MSSRRYLGAIGLGITSLALVLLLVATLGASPGGKTLDVKSRSSSARSVLAQPPDVPASQSVQAVVAPLLPAGTQLTHAEDRAGVPPVSIAEFALPNGQGLRVYRQKLSLPLPPSMDPHLLIRDPRTDSVTQLTSGATLVKIGHSDGTQQVILGRPNGTVINMIVWTPSKASSTAGFTPAFSLDSLASAVQQKLDAPSSDLP